MATQLFQPPHGSPAWFYACVDRSKHGVLAERVTIRPDLAQEILKQNPDNRNIKDRKAAQYAADIVAGRWVFNGEPIIISKDGLLNDGQHRLSGVVAAGGSIDAVMIFGIDRETRVTVDQGASRGAGDYLAMEGSPNANICASIARVVIAYDKAEGANILLSPDVTNAEILQRVATDKLIIESAEFASLVSKGMQKFAAPAIIGSCFYILSRVSRATAQEYMDRVCHGENIRRGDPAFAVREALLSMGKTQRQSKMEVIFRGWAKHKRGQPLKLAKVMGSFPAVS